MKLPRDGELPNKSKDGSDAPGSGGISPYDDDDEESVDDKSGGILSLLSMIVDVANNNCCCVCWRCEENERREREVFPLASQE